MNGRRIFTFALALLMGMIALGFGADTAEAAPPPKPKFRVAWSIYVGWMPWDYANQAGILKRWADKNGIEIELIRMDYVPSIEAYVGKQVDAVVLTNMEGLDMPAAAGIDTTVLIMGDYSNDNDQVLTRGIPTIAGIRGKKVYLAQNTVSEYLLRRAFEMNGIPDNAVTLVNTSDADIGPAFIANPSQEVVVTWNPMAMQIASQVPGARKVFGSAQIPGEILDLTVVRTDVLQKNPALGKALTGAWYEVMALLQQRGNPARRQAIEHMARESGATVTEFEGQLRTTAVYYTADSAAAFTESKDVQRTMDRVRKFCFERGLLGENAKSADDVGISFPDGTVLGNPKNIKFRFDSSFMRLAASGQL